MQLWRVQLFCLHFPLSWHNIYYLNYLLLSTLRSMLFKTSPYFLVQLLGRISQSCFNYTNDLCAWRSLWQTKLGNWDPEPQTALTWNHTLNKGMNILLAYLSVLFWEVEKWTAKNILPLTKKNWLLLAWIKYPLLCYKAVVCWICKTLFTKNISLLGLYCTALFLEGSREVYLQPNNPKARM